VGQAKPPANQPATRKYILDLFGRGAGCHVEILGGLSKQQITDAAAHDKGFEAGILQVSNDFGRVGAEFFQPNAMFGLGNGEVTINIIYAR
jgi:hypothetical protein